MESKDHLTWRKARASSVNGDCVEVADEHGVVLVRDTKARETGHLAVIADRWRAFVDELKAGQQTLLGRTVRSNPR